MPGTSALVPAARRSGRLFARCRLGARISTVPPAFSTAATADFDAPNTESAIFALSLAPAEKPHPVLGAAQHAGLDQGRSVDRAAGVELAGIDRRPGCGPD